MVQTEIVVRGAREHNLKNIDVVIPRDKLTVVTGLSGSGKSTLVFDTIYAEGQRRYVESLSAYARQFLGVMNKPDVDSIDGLSPAISIEQKTTSKNPRSTVGTVTEIYDYLRLLFARIGVPYCPEHNVVVQPQSAEQIAEKLLENKGKKVLILAPVVRGKKGTYEKLFEKIKADGFVRVRVDNHVYSVDETIELDRYVKHNIEIVVDRIVIDERKRLQEAVESALKFGEGYVIIYYDEDRKEEIFSSLSSCPVCGTSFEELQPRMFSFNSPFGACEECHGIGVKMEFDSDLVIPNKELSLMQGAVAAFGNYTDNWRLQQLSAVAKHFGFSMATPVKYLKKEVMDIIFYGSKERIKYNYTGKDSSFTTYGDYEGVIPMLERLYKQTESEYRREEMEKFMVANPCDSCKGKKLKPTSLSVKINGKNIIEVTDFSISSAAEFFKNLKLSKKDEAIASQILKEINSRLLFLLNVGLDYLTLSRSAGTLSGGEAQRIRLATQIGSNLMGVLYVLDEPSIGLHQRDNKKLIDTLKRLRDLGNTVIVVEHDEETMLNADYIIDIGPGAGVHGGRIVAQGTPTDIMLNEKSITGQYLSHKKKIEVPKVRRQINGKYLEVLGASEHNLKNIDVRFPLNTLTLITGLSGSGKSTLIHDILFNALSAKINKSRVKAGKHKEVVIPSEVSNVVLVDQSPIGRTPRSNPATYTKVFDEVRNLFSSTKDAKTRGYGPGRFSFNVTGGRCENCEGDGVIKIEMQFLSDVYIECEQCKGKRYNKETLQVLYNGKNISDVLNMTVEEALKFFEHLPPLYRKLQVLFDVGLGYIKLGQPATTLSGGESQRIKLTRELAKRGDGHTIYILDEPTTGLHFDDVKKLLDVLSRLVDKGNTCIVIEHNLDVIKTADWIIDLGPLGGEKGGEIVGEGTPEEIVGNKESYTGEFLKRVLAKG